MTRNGFTIWSEEDCRRGLVGVSFRTPPASALIFEPSSPVAHWMLKDFAIHGAATRHDLTVQTVQCVHFDACHCRRANLATEIQFSVIDQRLLQNYQSIKSLEQGPVGAILWW